MNKSTRRMTVIPEPAEGTRSVLIPDFKGPAMKGQGPLSYTCGGCGATLLRYVEYKQIQNLVIRCFECGVHNEIPVTHHSN